MASKLRVDEIVGAQGSTVSIGTATFTGGLSGDITGLNVTGVITATTLNQNVSGGLNVTGVSTFSSGLHVTGTSAIENEQLQLTWSSPNGAIKAKNTVGSPAANLDFYSTDTGGNTNLGIRLQWSGNVGIGTDAPLHLLSVGDGTADTRMFVRSSDSYGIGFQNGTNQIGGWIGSPAAQTLGFFHFDGTERLRIQSGGGISFNGDTASANALDDYEEGTWTPIASASSGTITSYTSSGRYTKIGRIVTLHFAITISNQGTANGQYLLWSGAPFTASNTINQMGVAREMNVNGYLSSCLIQGNSTQGGFYRWDNSGVIVNGNFQAMVVYNVD